MGYSLSWDPVSGTAAFSRFFSTVWAGEIVGMTVQYFGVPYLPLPHCTHRCAGDEAYPQIQYGTDADLCLG